MSHISPSQARDSITRPTETDTNKVAMYELATCRAENYLLKQRMSDCENTMQGLKHLVAGIAEKQLKIMRQMLEMRKKGLVLPKITTMDSSTSTSDDGVLEYMSYSESDDWNGTPSTTRIFSPYISPRPSSELGSEHEVVPPQEEMEEEDEYYLTSNSMNSWNFLYTINEEIEPEDAQEELQSEETQPLLLQHDK